MYEGWRGIRRKIQTSSEEGGRLRGEQGGQIQMKIESSKGRDQKVKEQTYPGEETKLKGEKDIRRNKEKDKIKGKEKVPTGG